MALVLIDSMTNYNTIAEAVGKWDYWNSTMFPQATGGPFNNGPCMGLQNAQFAKSISTPIATVGVSGWFYNYDSIDWYIDFKRSGTVQARIRRESGTGTNYFKVYRGPSSTLLGQSDSFTLGSWVFFEFKVTTNDSTGTIDIRMDGTSLLSLSGIDTNNGGDSLIDEVYFSFQNSGNAPKAFGWTIWDSSGSDWNDFSGSYGVSVLYPDGAGNYTQWTPLSGSNYANVDEADFDNDTTYNYTDTAGNKDSFTYADLTATAGTIYGVSVTIGCREDDGGPRTIRPFVRISGTDYFGDTVSVPASYEQIQYIWHTSPATGSAWTISEINGAEFGYEMVA